MSKFKVGQRVERTAPLHGHSVLGIGSRGIVTDLSERGAYVVFDELRNDVIYVVETSLKKVEEDEEKLPDLTAMMLEVKRAKHYLVACRAELQRASAKFKRIVEEAAKLEGKYLDAVKIVEEAAKEAV